MVSRPDSLFRTSVLLLGDVVQLPGTKQLLLVRVIVYHPFQVWNMGSSGGQSSWAYKETAW